MFWSWVCRHLRGNCLNIWTTFHERLFKFNLFIFFIIAVYFIILIDFILVRFWWEIMIFMGVSINFSNWNTSIYIFSTGNSYLLILYAVLYHAAKWMSRYFFSKIIDQIFRITTKYQQSHIEIIEHINNDYPTQARTCLPYKRITERSFVAGRCIQVFRPLDTAHIASIAVFAEKSSITSCNLQ